MGKNNDNEMNSECKTVNVLYQCDNTYAPYMGVSLTSLLINNQDVEELNVYILDGAISEENREKVLATGKKYHRNIVFLECGFLDAKLKEIGVRLYRGSYATFYKVFILSILKEKNIHLDRLLYIDSDTVITNSILPLFTMDLDGCPIAMASDTLDYQYKKKLGYTKEEWYCSAGVILFDFISFEKGDWNRKLEYHIQEIKADYEKHEQDLFNVVFKNNIFVLPLRYNAQSIYAAATLTQYYKVYQKTSYYTQEDLEREMKERVILHFLRFCGEFPWTKDNIHPYREDFEKYLSQSEWKNMNKTTRNKKLSFCIERWIYKNTSKVFFLRLFKWCHDVLHLA